MADYAHLATPDPEFSDIWAKLQAPYAAPGTIDVAAQRHAMNAVAIPNIKAWFEPNLPPPSTYHVTAETVNIQSMDNVSKVSASLSRGFLVGGVSGGASTAAVLAYRDVKDQPSPYFPVPKNLV
ncbi:hypothetical protein B0H19DRAFT_1367942 [Mycena capillaripes]|nr:hypothetical protein B0H19DRAFT_1367942 [Mycena capillaripes]